MNVFYAMFDILGFKALLNELNTDGLYNRYLHSILPMIENASMPILKTIKRDGKDVMVSDNSYVRANYSFFSDTITFFSSNDSFDSFLGIHMTALEFLKSGFGMYMPMRGAIGYGDLIVDKYGIQVGTSIVDAYIGEQSQVWSGCIYTKNAEKFCQKEKYFEKYHQIFHKLKTNTKGFLDMQQLENKQKSLIKYNVPLQKKVNDKPIEYYNEELYALDWTKNVFNDASKKVFKLYKNDHQQRIRENTINFEEWARKNN
ncbi:hypothetical protein [Perlabentimonas gracilis]|uniref:hypothetical protein n=1 Tax=Perlabentimonas gracilis TaxID=2715279 RepID=UPI00140AA4D1|nr:hypothetical protein [Perlabentimonas gracilis]NHB70378.1 hypothetical protein [Perlabentimonas gracilis]